MGRVEISHHDSPLGRWTRALYLPAGPLAMYVSLCWYVAGRAHFARDRRLPSGAAHLLFNLASPPVLFDRDPAQAPRAFPTCWLSGQQEGYIETGSDGPTLLLGAQFASHGAWRLLQVPQYELAGQVIELEALFGDAIRRLRERLLAAPDPQTCFALLEGWLLQRLASGGDVHASVLATRHEIERAPGQLALKTLSRDLGVSREHVIRRFREQVGLTPKAYANVLRFQRALHLARRARRSWAELAADCGYYDQAHLARDFQRYAGRTPTSLLRDAWPDADSIVVQ